MPVALLVRVAFWLWFGAALAAGYFLALQRVSPLATPGIILALTTLLLWAYFRSAPLRAWVDALDLRSLVLLHVTRFVGIYLLILYQRGGLPRSLLVPGGLADIIVATMALPVALAPLDPGARHRAIRIWNIVGLVGMLFAILTIARLSLTAPLHLRVLTHLPLSLLPTFLLPLLLATHFALFVRTAREPRSA